MTANGMGPSVAFSLVGDVWEEPVRPAPLNLFFIRVKIRAYNETIHPYFQEYFQ